MAGQLPAHLELRILHAEKMNLLELLLLAP